MTDDIAFMTVTQLVGKFRARELSPVEAVDAALARIAAHDETVNAFCCVDADGARTAAREAEARWMRGAPKGRLDGVPLSVKDTLLAKGFPTRFGSMATGPEAATDDTSSVAAVRRHGAVLLGKTTTPEFGLGPVTISPLTGTTRNPWDPTKHAGGSSGGAGAALAAGMGNVALGSDAGGSIRIPASFNGLVGFKASFGRVPVYPPSGVPGLSSLGALARTVDDAALMLDVMAEPDWRDWQALPHDGHDGTDFRAGLDEGVRGLKIAFSPTLGFAERLDPEVRDAATAAAHAFAALGATVEEADPEIDDPTALFVLFAEANVANRLGRLQSERFDLLGARVRAAVERGRAVSLAAYLEAQDRRAELGFRMQRFHQNYDLLLTPTVALPPFPAELWVPETFAGARQERAWAPFCNAFNLTQQPAISLPCGFTESGLPIGLQIVGARYADALVLKAARAYELAHPATDRRAAL